VCRSFGCWRARITVAGREGGREPRRSAAAVSRTGRGRAGADHVEVEVVFVCSFVRAAVVIVVVVGDRGEGDHCLPRRERSQGRAVGRARCGGRRKMLLPRLPPPPPPPLHRFESASSITVGTSFRHYCICRRRLLQQVQLSHNRRAPQKSRTRGGDELNGRNVMGRQAERVGVVAVGMARVASFCECPNSLVHSRGKSSATLVE